jgi:Fe-S cluster assembly protein SufD
MTTLVSTFNDALAKLDKPFFAAEKRKNALERFEAKGFPTTDWEAWRRTDVSDVTAHPFLPARLVPASQDLAARYALPGASVRLTFVNGFFVPALSDIEHLPEGVEAGPLASRPEVDHLGGLTPLADDPFAALNTALFPDGAFLRVTRGTVAEAPIHVLFLTVPDNRPTFLTPRLFVRMGENAQATLVETHAGGATGHLSAAVSEIDLGPASRLTHLRRVLDLGDGAHLGHVQARQARNSFYGSHSMVFGGSLVRNRIGATQEGEGAECSFDGVALARGRERVDHQTVIDHAAPHGTSREAYKYLLADRARGVFNGEVIIRPGAQKVDSAQINTNLLLSDQALVHTKPDLRIFADDVKAKHGATIGQLNKDMVFYCRSRGFSLEEAKRLLTQAFVVDVIERIAYEPLRELSLKAVGAWWGEPL